MMPLNMMVEVIMKKVVKTMMMFLANLVLGEKMNHFEEFTEDNNSLTPCLRIWIWILININSGVNSSRLMPTITEVTNI